MCHIQRRSEVPGVEGIVTWAMPDGTVPGMWSRFRGNTFKRFQDVHLRILASMVIYDSEHVSPEHLLLSWYPSHTLALNVLYVPYSLGVGADILT